MRTLTTSVFQILTVCGIAQLPYRTIPTSGAEWHERHSWSQDWDNTVCLRTISSGTDTLIAGELYHRLITQGSCQLSTQFGAYVPYAESPADLWYFREDTTARQVLAYDPSSQSEVLLLDFSIAAGDYPMSYLSSFVQLAVLGIDSVELADGGHNRMALGLASGFVMLHLIEGVGATAGFNIPPIGVGPAPLADNQLLCHSVNGVVIYSSGTGCDLSTSAQNALAVDEPLRLQPNPAVEEFRVFGGGPDGSTFKARDALGRVRFGGNVVNGLIECGSWPAGLYIITIRDQEGKERDGRMVKL